MFTPTYHVIICSIAVPKFAVCKERAFVRVPVEGEPDHLVAVPIILVLVQLQPLKLLHCPECQNHSAISPLQNEANIVPGVRGIGEVEQD